MKNKRMNTFLCAVLSAILIDMTHAQTYLMQEIPKINKQLGVRYQRPMFKYKSDLSTLSGIYEFSANILLHSKSNLQICIPYIITKFKDRDKEDTIGNLYFGYQIRPKSKNGKFSVNTFGITLPFAEEDEIYPSIVAIYADLSEIQKYTPNLLSLLWNFAFYNQNPAGDIFGFELGPTLWIPTKDQGDNELLLRYGVMGGFQASQIQISAEFIGIGRISEDVDDFRDRFIHSLLLGIQYKNNTLNCGLFYKIPLKEDWKDIVDSVLGIRLNLIL